MDRHGKFKTIVENHQEQVRNICFSFVKNREDADEIAQDVFVQVHESLSRFREESKLTTWIYRIAVNKCLDHLRYTKRKKRFAQLTSLFGIGKETGEIAYAGPDNPQDDLETRERRRILDAAIEKLPRSQQIVIILNKYEGMKAWEIAELMDISPSAVEALSHRARKNLQKLLYTYFDSRT